METIIQNIVGYINSLDWAYILTFILIAYVLNHQKVTEFLSNGLGIRIATRYRVLIVGIVYAIGIFFIRDYRLSDSEVLFQSFVFAMVFHKLIVDTLVKKLKKATTTDPSNKNAL